MEAVKKKLKDKALDVSIMDMLKEVGTMTAEIRLQVLKFKGKTWFAILIRGKEDKEE